MAKLTKGVLANATMEKLLKKAGAFRVSDSAKEALKEVLEAYAEMVGHKAVRLAKHSGRKTVKNIDVKEAVR